MNAFVELKSQLVKALAQLPGLEGAVVTDEYPSMGKPQSIVSPLIAVGFEKIETIPSSFSHYLGRGSSGESLMGSRWQVTVLFTLCAPKNLVAPQLFSLFDGLSQLLLQPGDLPSPIQSLWCDPIIFDQTLGCPVLKAYGKMEIWVSTAPQEGDPIGEYTVRSVMI